jgi:lipopolysaccharide/colanic/teichoic acid biosynthesis glycosyltransferase
MMDSSEAFAVRSELLVAGPKSDAKRRSPQRGSEQPGVGEQSGLRYAGPYVPELTLQRKRHLALKRVLDVAVAAIAGVALSPLLLAIWIAVIATSPGAALFRQERTGLGGRKFVLLKFRTMYVDRGDHSGVAQTRVGDERVTPFGRWLRRTNLDELPQLWNVLGGEMSLVGPRPHVEGMKAAGVDYRDLVSYYDLRLVMPPGLSGWAQANGLRGPTEDADEAWARIDHDLAYIQNFSVWLDIRIIVLTAVRECFGGTGL